MALNQNQFAQTPIKGMMDLEGFGSNVIAARIDAAQVTPLVPGQAVKLVTTSTNLPDVISLAANSEGAFGFVSYNLKDAEYAANDRLEIALFGSAMYMEAGAAINAGASVEVVSVGNKVITSAGINPVVGIALEAATTNGDLIRVMIQAPWSGIQSNLTNRTQSIYVEATLAELNAGKTLIPAVAGRSIIVTDYIARVTGGFTTGTNIILQSSNGSPVVVTTIAEAGLTNGAILNPASANTTLGAGFATALGSGDGLRVVSTGTQAAGTKIGFTITFTQ